MRWIGVSAVRMVFSLVSRVWYVSASGVEDGEAGVVVAGVSVVVEGAAAPASTSILSSKLNISSILVSLPPLPTYLYQWQEGGCER